VYEYGLMYEEPNYGTRPYCTRDGLYAIVIVFCLAVTIISFKNLKASF
jgi:hypothetical protein